MGLGAGWRWESFALSKLAWAVWPSFHRNSRVRRKGVGSLNSHRTTLDHWLSFRGRSRWLRIQSAKAGRCLLLLGLRLLGLRRRLLLRRLRLLSFRRHRLLRRLCRLILGRLLRRHLLHPLCLLGRRRGLADVPLGLLRLLPRLLFVRDALGLLGRLLPRGLRLGLVGENTSEGKKTAQESWKGRFETDA